MPYLTKKNGTLFLIAGFLLLFSFTLAAVPCLHPDCCEDNNVDCFCVQCLMHFNNVIEPSTTSHDIPQKVCQSVVECQTSLNLLELAFEIDQPPKILI